MTKGILTVALQLALVPALVAQQHSSVVVNEFLASNVSTNADIVDFDDFSDWIELYNREDVDIDLGGYSLTDDPRDPSKWPLPPGTFIPAHGFLFLWADGQDDVPGTPHTRPYAPFEDFYTRYYHLNFKLDAAGEFIGLAAPDGTLIDSVVFGMQLNDVSRGRQPDGEANWYYFGEPTPDATNTTEGIATTDRVGTPDVTPPAGFYGTAQLITVSMPSPEARVRYTLDGSIPTSQSPLYSDPVPIDRTTALRLRVFQAGKLPGPILTYTYFLNEPTYLPVVSISTDPRLLWDNSTGIYDNIFREREIPVHLELFEPGGIHGVSVDAGLTLTGQLSIFYPQKSFTISTDDRFGDEAVGYQVFPERELNTFFSLYLRNGGLPDHRSTLIRDALLHTLVFRKMDLDCQAYRPVTAFLDGRYWGIYTLREKINGAYLSATAQSQSGKAGPAGIHPQSRTRCHGGGCGQLQYFLPLCLGPDLSNEKTTGPSGDDGCRRVHQLPDRGDLLRQCDLGRSERADVAGAERDARWRWILFDTDYGFGMPNQISNGYTHNTLRYATSSNYGSIHPPGLVHAPVPEAACPPGVPDEVHPAVCGYLNTVFHPDTVVAAIDRMRDELSPGMSRHIARWNTGPDTVGVPIPDYSAWLTNVSVLRSFARGRPAYQRQHIVDYFSLGGIAILEAAVVNEGMGSILINDVERVVSSTSSRYFKGVTTRLQAVPEVGYRFVRWEGIDSAYSNPVDIVPAADTLTVTAVFEATAASIVPDRITMNTTLDAVHSPFYARVTTTVDSGVTLRITGGTRLLMPEGGSLVVHGRLLVEGTAQDPVTFEPNEQSRRWGALCFVDAADSSAVSNLIVRGASRGPDFTRDWAAISGYRSRFSLENVSMTDVQMPVFVQYGSVTIRGCRLRSPVAGDLINVKYADFALTESCDLMGDDEYDSDGIDYDGVASGAIRGNRIRNIYGFNSDAIDLGEGARDILVEGNWVYNVTDKGVSVGQGSTTLIRRNIIANCGMGVAVKDFNSFARVEQSTFYANQVGIASYEKILGHGGGRAEAVNCIIADSRTSATFVDGLSALGISYSISNTDILAGLHNVNADPRLLNEFRLAQGSPAIDTGSPLLPVDPDGSLPDIGARPLDAQRQDNVFIDEIHYHPQEGSGLEFIEIVNAGQGPVHLGGYRVEGDVRYVFGDLQLGGGERLVVAKSAGPYQGKGYQVLQWDAGELPDGAGTLLFRNAAGDTIDFVDYNSRYFWPLQPDGLGPSLETHGVTLENLVSTSWRASYVLGGTPGRSSGSVALVGLFINEFMAENDTACVDEEGEHDDWIEIYNSNPIPVDLGGMGITDNLSRPDKWIVPRTDPQLTIVPAGGFLVLWADGQPEQGVLHLGFKLDKAGEAIGLAQDLDSGFVFIDSLSFGGQAADVSYGRYPDGSPVWSPFSKSSPGSSNQGPDDVVESRLPTSFALFQNYPNPFNPETVISYQLPVTSPVKLTVYDILGREVMVLVDETRLPGKYEARFSVTGGTVSGRGGTGLASGVYIYRLTAGSYVEAQRMLLLK